MQFIFDNTNVTIEQVEKVTDLIVSLHKDFKDHCSHSYKCENCEFFNVQLLCNEQDEEMFIFDADKHTIVTKSVNYAAMLELESGVLPTIIEES